MHYILKEPNSNNLSLILLRVYSSKEKKYFKVSTNIKINPDNWNKKTKLPVLKRGAEAIKSRQITTRLLEFQERVLKLKIIHGKNLTINHLKDEFAEKKNLLYFLDHFELFIKERKDLAEVSLAQLKKYNVVLKKLIAFQLYKRKKYRLEDIDEKFFLDLVIYLRMRHNLYDNTLSSYVATIKTFMRWSKNKGFKVKDDYQRVRIKTHSTDDIALTQEEVSQLEEVSLKGAKDRARDLFLVGIYSGQRFSDYSKIQKANLRDGMLIIRAKKTRHISKVPLSEKLENILEKYDWELPLISSQKFNPHIQQICKIIGMTQEVLKISYQGNKVKKETKPKWKMVGSHTARRTFITIASEKGMSDHYIMTIAGIKDPNTLNKYKKDNDKVMSEQFKELF